ncbi:MAG: hypothetical protein EOO16_10110 [Chitinophagaceae bacterium]|nr:MAG: hypothetical protein EOO16_10110 [Chitinophagaceae bacterium]
MTQHLKNQWHSAIAGYRAVTRDALPVVTVPGILLLALVGYLFYVLFQCCFRGTRGSETIRAFKSFLVSLQDKLSRNTGTPDLASERVALERVQNKIKTYNTGDEIRADPRLRFVFVRTYNAVAEAHSLATEENNVEYIRLSALLQEFYDQYFSAAQAGSRPEPRWLKGLASLPTAAMHPVRSKRLPIFPRPSLHSRS